APFGTGPTREGPMPTRGVDACGPRAVRLRCATKTNGVERRLGPGATDFFSTQPTCSHASMRVSLRARAALTAAHDAWPRGSRIWRCAWSLLSRAAADAA